MRISVFMGGRIWAGFWEMQANPTFRVPRSELRVLLPPPFLVPRSELRVLLLNTCHVPIRDLGRRIGMGLRQEKPQNKFHAAAWQATPPMARLAVP